MSASRSYLEDVEFKIIKNADTPRKAVSIFIEDMLKNFDESSRGLFEDVLRCRGVKQAIGIPYDTDCMGDKEFHEFIDDWSNKIVDSVEHDTNAFIEVRRIRASDKIE